MNVQWVLVKLAVMGMLFGLANTAWSARLALVIGNQSYPSSGAFSLLANPHNDANDMAGLLRDLGFDRVDMIQDASKSEFERAVSAFARRIQPGDSVVFYFSGHGISVAGVNYLIPLPGRGNGPLTNASQVQSGAVAISSVLDSISDRNPAATLFLLDACRNEMKVSRRNGFESRGFSQMSANGALLAYASSPGKAALGSPQSRNSLYTKHFLQQTRANPGQSVEDLLKQVRVLVHQESNGDQIPWNGSNLLADLCLSPCGKRKSIVGVPAPAPVVVQPTVIEQPSAAQPSRSYRVGDVDFKLVYIPSGSFDMGSNNRLVNEKPVHPVNISGFYMMETEVTWSLYKQCIDAGSCADNSAEHLESPLDGIRPLELHSMIYSKSSKALEEILVSRLRQCVDDGGCINGNIPVIFVNWNDITNRFIPWLNRKTGKIFRLPSESEWEYGARAGSTTKYSWGDSISCSKARYGYVSKECGKQKSSDPVKSFRPNNFGLYDMHGNVYEWTQDCWIDHYNSGPYNNQARESRSCGERVVRGGSWADKAASLRSSFRDRSSVYDRYDFVGFRLVQDL